MKQYIYKAIFPLLIFIVCVWTINSLLFGFVDSDLDNINNLRKEISLKKSFSEQDSPEKLSKSINEFIPEKLDKVAVTNLITKLAQESFITINNIEIVEVKNNKVNKNISEIEIKNNSKSISDENLKTNTLNQARLDIKLSGVKSSLDRFISKLSESNQYIDIDTIQLDLQSKSSDSQSQDLNMNVVGIIYYKNL